MLSDDFVHDVRRMNPWWTGDALPVLPATRRHLVRQMRSRLSLGLAPIVLVRGPRQIGKTTAQLHMIQDLLAEGVSGSRILRLQCDDLPSLEGLAEPLLRVVDWFESEVLGETLNAAAAEGRSTYLFFDEVQNLRKWAPQLKFLVDSSTTRAVVTGSSALRMELGRDSLAGRITTIEAGVLSLTEIASFRGIELGDPFLRDNGIDPVADQSFWKALESHGREVAGARDEAFRHFSERGGYPLVHRNPDATWTALADQLNENVIRRVIQHDLRVDEQGRERDGLLVEEIFRLACRYVGQEPGAALLAREAQRATHAEVGSEHALQVLRLLAGTLLVRLVEPLEIRLKKRSGNAKICLADHALRASWLQEVVPLDPEGLLREPQMSTLAGRVAESVVGAVLSTISSLDLAHLPARAGEPEVDFVLTVGTRRIPLEVKYQRKIDPMADTEGLRTFIEKTVNNAPFGVLVTQADTDVVTDPRIVALPLSSVMLLR